MEVPLKTKNRLTIWSSNHTLGQTSKEDSNSKRYMHTNVHSSTIYNSQGMEAMEVSTGRWMNEEDMVYIHNGYYWTIETSVIMPFCSNMDDLEIILSEVS